MAIQLCSKLTAREYTQALEQQMEKTLSELALYNPRAYQTKLATYLADAQELTRSYQRVSRVLVRFVDDLSADARSVIESVGGSIFTHEPDGTASGEYRIQIPMQAILKRSTRATDGHEVLYLGSAGQHCIGIGLRCADTKYAYEACYRI